MRELFLALLVVTGVAMASPGTAAAQSSCTTKCGCYSDGCGCQSEGGNGGDCSSTGSGCFVKKCGTELQSVAMAADGSFVELQDVIPAFASVPGDASTVAAVQRTIAKHPAAAGWQFISRGHAVARSCSGIIIARFYDADAASGIRATKDLTI